MRKFINDLKKDLADFKEINKWGKFKIKHMWHPWALKVVYPSTLVLLFLIILMMDSCDSGSSKKIVDTPKEETKEEYSPTCFFNGQRPLDATKEIECNYKCDNWSRDEKRYIKRTQTCPIAY